MKGFGFREREEAKPPSSSSSSSAGSSWSSLSSAFHIFDPYRHQQSTNKHGNHGWVSAVKRIVGVGPMRRIHERFLLGSARRGVPNSASDIWLLGIRYNVSSDDEAAGLAAFEKDFSSRVLLTYRKGFDAIGESSFTSDVNWGCMLRSSQMLIAQALVCHRLGRSWRKPSDKLLSEEYIDILHLFGDSEVCPFSIHNLIESGKAYGLAAGSWVGPYATCRSWEILIRSKRERAINQGGPPLPMAVYVVSGDEDGERGGAPVMCIDDARKHCSEFSQGQAEWAPILLLVPLVLGLEKVNPRYIPSLRAIFSFPQSLGVLGGKPSVSTYMIGVQDDEVFYLDPHEVQPAVNINRDNLEADTSSFHCSVTRHITLNSLDPSLALGFYCRDKDDFDNFCSRASKLAFESNGAPLFTVTETRSSICNSSTSKAVNHGDPEEVDYHWNEPRGPAEGEEEDEWQLL